MSATPKPYESAKLYREDYNVAIKLQREIELDQGASVAVLEVLGAGIAALASMPPVARRRLLRQRMAERRGEPVPA